MSLENMVSKNFKYLLKISGDKQTPIAKIFGTSQSVISGYVNGNPIPVEVLAKISDRYGVSTDDLINKDLSLEYDFPFTLNIKQATDAVLKCFPFFTSDIAKTNDSFNRAENIMQNIFQIDDLSELDNKICIFEHSIELYQKAWRESKTYIALANSISLIFLIHYIYSQYNVDIANELIKTGKLNFNKIIQKTLRDPSKTKPINPYSQKRKSFFIKHYQTVFDNIKKLKQNIKYSDLGDFYLALCYVDGYILDEAAYETSMQTAGMMLLQQEELGNHYAINFLKFFENIVNPDNLE